VECEDDKGGSEENALLSEQDSSRIDNGNQLWLNIGEQI